MSTIRSTPSITGTLEGTTHTLAGSSTRGITGHPVESVELTTAFTDIQMPIGTGKTLKALVVNTGSTEVKVRIERVAATTWDYFNIPAGRFFEFSDNVGSFIDSAIVSIAVRTMSGTGRAVVHQGWM